MIYISAAVITVVAHITATKTKLLAMNASAAAAKVENTLSTISNEQSSLTGSIMSSS